MTAAAGSLQDKDAVFAETHIYCEPEQVPDEIDRFFQMTAEVYQKLGVDGIEMAVSTRPEKFLGEPADWDVAEKALITAVERAGFHCRIKPGEAAFYAPKVEADFKNVLGRAWTLATIQIDMAMPGRFVCVMSGVTESSTSPRCCIARCSAPSSASSASTSSTPAATSPSGCRPSRPCCSRSPTATRGVPMRSTRSSR